MSKKEREDKPDLYWLGVRDALRMVDSFVKWSKKHPKKAKTLDQFIADGLIAAAKRCENRLTRALGITYADKGELGATDDDADREEVGFADDSLPEIDESLSAISTRQPEHEFERSIPIEPEETIAPLESEEYEELPEYEEAPTEAPVVPEMAFSDDLTFEGKKREFEEDFDLAEPTPFIVESDTTDTETEVAPPPDVILPGEYDETETESKMLEALEGLGEFTPDEEIAEEPEIEPEILTTSSEESEIELETKPGFTWKEYESTLTPPEMPSEKASAPLKPEVWSPYDEPPVVEEEEPKEEDIASEEHLEAIEDELLEDDSESIQPPPPPPPPETDESEEERRRRARRLFFGD